MSAQYAAKWLRQDDAFLSKTATQLGQLRGIYDLDHNWDVGLQGEHDVGRVVPQPALRRGRRTRRRVINNLRVAAGYNLFGFRERTCARPTTPCRAPTCDSTSSSTSRSCLASRRRRAP